MPRNNSTSSALPTLVAQARSANEAQRETRRQAWLASQIEVTEGGET